MNFLPSSRAVFALAFAFIACLASTRGTARALVEFCPATISQPHSVSGGGGQLYSATLGALSSRTVQADVEAQTANGWYAVSLQPTAIAEREVKYQNSEITFTREEAWSQLFYVRFPKDAGKVLHWWVTDATSTGDGMSWDGKGKVTCVPFATLADLGQQPAADPLTARRVNPPELNYDRVPNSNDTIAVAVGGAPVQNLKCGAPFVAAIVRKPVAPDWPGGVSITQTMQTLVRVAVGADGRLADAWVYQPSGLPTFDQAAVAAARQSTYAAGTAFCAPAPGEYLYRARFTPN